MTGRRNFIRNTLITGAGIAMTPSFGFSISKSKPRLDDQIIGHGNFRYRVHQEWGNLDRAKTPVKNCHEMVMDSKGRLIMITDETKNNIIIYDKSGKLLKTWGTGFPGGHGLSLTKEGGEDFLFISDTNLSTVNKTTVDGKTVLQLDHLKKQPRTSGRFTFTTYKFYQKDSKLLKSGMVGPVRILLKPTTIDEN